MGSCDVSGLRRMVSDGVELQDTQLGSEDCLVGKSPPIWFQREALTADRGEWEGRKQEFPEDEPSSQFMVSKQGT